MQEVITKYLNLLYDLFLYDVEVFSQGWIYAWVLLPAIGYLVFFCVKWFILTLPFWLPIKILIDSLSKLIQVAKKTRKSK